MRTGSPIIVRCVARNNVVGLKKDNKIYNHSNSIMKKTSFLSVPEDVLISLVSSWLGIKELIGIDFAFCNKSARKEIDRLLKHPLILVDTTQLKYSTFWYSWLARKRVCFNHFLFMGTKETTGRNSSLNINAEKITSLRVEKYNANQHFLLTELLNRCYNLTHVSLDDSCGVIDDNEAEKVSLGILENVKSLTIENRSFSNRFLERFVSLETFLVQIYNGSSDYIGYFDHNMFQWLSKTVTELQLFSSESISFNGYWYLKSITEHCTNLAICFIEVNDDIHRIMSDFIVKLQQNNASHLSDFHFDVKSEKGSLHIVSKKSDYSHTLTVKFGEFNVFRRSICEEVVKLLNNSTVSYETILIQNAPHIFGSVSEEIVKSIINKHGKVHTLEFSLQPNAYCSFFYGLQSIFKECEHLIHLKISYLSSLYFKITNFSFQSRFKDDESDEQTEEFYIDISQSAMKLQTLELFMCDFMHKKGLSTIIRLCPSLKKVVYSGEFNILFNHSFNNFAYEREKITRLADKHNVKLELINLVSPFNNDDSSDSSDGELYATCKIVKFD